VGQTTNPSVCPSTSSPTRAPSSHSPSRAPHTRAPATLAPVVPEQVKQKSLTADVVYKQATCNQAIVEEAKAFWKDPILKTTGLPRERIVVEALCGSLVVTWFILYPNRAMQQAAKQQIETQTVVNYFNMTFIEQRYGTAEASPIIDLSAETEQESIPSQGVANSVVVSRGETERARREGRER